MSIVVFGSVNMDLVARASRLPNVGETVLGDTFETVPGGKGANQAVTCGRLGAPVAFVGRVGRDAFGDTLLQSLATANVDIGSVTPTLGSSGVALIEVDEHGQNRIVVVPGANGEVGADDLARLKARLKPGDLLLLQLEIPLDVVVAAAGIAKEQGALVMLDPAPAPTDLPSALWSLVDFLTPNETETRLLSGVDASTLDGALQAARNLLARGPKSVVVKRGDRGALYVDERGVLPVDPFDVESVDTVGAGDAFNGGFAAALAEGRSLPEALRFASATAALSVTKRGAQDALPTRSQVEVLLG
ncbi:ribokinase [Deinococcus yavapaiensis]|uniref:Ribokinase n=1 Tax=Deinococcus yavapaiensis KR-236 TaxID=694435 RepID=A0A318S9C1_9DEIO|nr:ribokinase [Deinococcus yavapaiensis]PYE52807.1 ribokinase [Deinococcus yavapaiensis KR-236]